MDLDIHAILREKIGSGEPGAAVATALHGEISQISARGFANMEWQQEIAPDTVFRIGSLTKQFTACAIMLLQERGGLSIDDPIIKFMPDVPGTYRTISLRNLLTHTSGIPNYTDIPGFWIDHSKRSVTPQEASAFFTSLPLEFEPGSRFRYSNSGYILLGQVVEVASGQPYETFLAEAFFKPLAMHQTCSLASAPIIKHQASGYVRQGQGFGKAPYMSMTWPYAAGALASSVIDLCKWQSALSAGEVLDRGTLGLMHQRTCLSDGSECPYGMGWLVEEKNGIHIVHHSGAVNGFVSYALWAPKHNFTVVVLSNLFPFPAEQVGQDIAKSMLQAAEREAQ